jgi:hypothetical protein
MFVKNNPKNLWDKKPTKVGDIPQIKGLFPNPGVRLSYSLVIGPLIWERSHPRAWGQTQL